MDAYQRRARRLIRLAYPPRYRVERGDELLGVLLDLAEPGSTRPPARLTLDVLRAGAWFRLRTHPPLWSWLAYRYASARLHPRWRGWVRDDILGRFYWLRHALLSCTIGSAVAITDRGDRVYVAIWWSVGLAATFLLRGRARRQGLKRHGFSEQGEPLETWQAEWEDVYSYAPGPREQVWPLLLVFGVVAGLVGAVSGGRLVAALPSARIWCGAALAAGAVLAALARARLARRLPLRPAEPDRLAARLPPLWFAAAAMLITAIGVGYVLATWLQPPTMLPTTPLALAGAPPVLTVALAARRAERAAGLVVTLREVWLGVVGADEVIPPEQPVSLPFPPPPAAG